MADFLTAYNLTAKNEGGYTDNPADNGNWTGGHQGQGRLIGTNLGISAPVLNEYLKGDATVADMRGLAKETAQKIYRKNYWAPVRGDEIESQDVANSIYDSAVNMNPRQAIILAQRAARIPETGHMDDFTLNTINNRI